MKTFDKILFILLSAYFLFFTFFDLNWGAPFYFHPDERNIATAIAQLNIMSNMNPHFYAYGQFPIYTTYLLGNFFNFLATGTVNYSVTFEQAIIIGRLISALLSIGLIFLIYKIALFVKNKDAAILAFVMSTTSVAFLQFNHFGTFEIWLSSLYLSSTYFILKFLKSKNISDFIIAVIFFSISWGLKLSSFSFLPVILVAILIAVLEQNSKARFSLFVKLTGAVLIFLPSFYFFTSPFNFIDFKSFLDSMRYETSVANGILPVFYTGFFNNQFPIIYQLQKVMPFLLNPFITLIFLPATLYVLYMTYKHKSSALLIVLLSFACLFISGSFLFVKWTRYMIPAVPYIYIISSLFIVELIKNQKLLKLTTILFVFIGIFFSFSFIKTVRIDQDSRISALLFAKKNIPKNSKILSEVYDLGIVPFNSSYSNIELFNFYDLDNNDFQKQLLQQTLKKHDVIILPSQRTYQGRIDNPTGFPQGYKFYSDLFSEQLDFVKIYETPCDFYCKITYMGNPVFNVEQTVNVFDRPTVYIFKKM